MNYWKSVLTACRQRRRTTSKALQVLHVSVKVRVHDSAIRMKVGINENHGKDRRWKSLLTTKNTELLLIFTKKMS